MYLFKIDKTSNQVLHEHALQLSPELRVLNEQEALTVILAHDYHSPYNQFPLEDRERRAYMHVYNTTDSDNFFRGQKIKKAVEEYRALQYNPKIELINSYNAKIQELNRLLSKEKTIDGIKNVTSSIKELRKYVIEMEKEILADSIEEGKIVGDKDRSWLEKMQSNQANYKAQFVEKKVIA